MVPFKEVVVKKYGAFDPLRYIKEADNNTYLLEYLFTMAIFGQLDEVFEQSEYTEKEILYVFYFNTEMDIE